MITAEELLVQADALDEEARSTEIDWLTLNYSEAEQDALQRIVRQCRRAAVVLREAAARIEAAALIKRGARGVQAA
jgi:hypothetical protein